MAEPLRSGPVKHLSNLVRIVPSLLSHSEKLCWLKNLLQKVRATTLRPALQEEAIKVHRRAGNIRVLAKVLVGTIETNLTLAAVRIGALVDSQPLYFSDTAVSPVLPCARS